MVAHYKKPSRINFVSVLLMLGFASAVYGAVFFGPAYFRKWSVSEILDEAASPCRSNLTPSSERLRELQEKARSKILALGVEDPGTRVDIELKRGEVTVSAEYREVIRHPVIKKETTLVFTPSITRSRGGF